MFPLDLYVLFICIAVFLLIIEVILGMTLGIALSGSITFFALGFMEWLNLFHGLNNYLVVGAIIFLISTYFVLKFFRNSSRANVSQKDVNDY